MEKYYLGMSFGFNSSACLMSNKRGLIAAISQERLNGEKNTKEIPFDAALKCLEISGVKEIDAIAVSHYEDITNEYLLKYSKHTIGGFTWGHMILDFFKKKGIIITTNTIERVHHHIAHRYSPFGFYGLPKSDEHWFAITSDGFGDGLSGTIYSKDFGTLSKVKLENSIALVYQFVTGALGFKEHQHEGKITGLAAFGTPKYIGDFEAMYDVTSEGNYLSFKTDEMLTAKEKESAEHSPIIDFDRFLLLKKTVYRLVDDLIAKGASREDIAASVQEFAERYTLLWIKNVVLPYEVLRPTVYLSGGLFANVKINQRIKDSGLFENVYVCPAMGDEGTCVGAVIQLMKKYDDCNFETLSVSDKVISGSYVDGDEDTYDNICDLINQNRLQDKLKITFYRNMSDTIEFISNALANNKIVCLMRDRMEFGPRALCHRSILYNCNSKETNQWLNDKLGRTEFMPFAPVCREENDDDLFVNLDRGRDSAKFMTMTFDCTAEFAQNYPAACHIDNTARPQIVHMGDDYFMWEILKQYEEKTGLKALINTSFNLHNNPIIESEEVGFDSWLKSETDILVIGNVIIERV